MTKIKTMTAGEAYEKAGKDSAYCFGTDETPFALLGWKSPENGRCYGPYLVAKMGDIVVEITRSGRFKTMYPAEAEYYFPYIDTNGDL